MIATGPGWELRLGDWREVLTDVEASALISDPPYSARTHSKQRHGRRESQWVPSASRWASARGIPYAHWSPDDVHEFVDSWAPRCTGWFGALTDSELIHAWRDAYAAHGRTNFAPLACVQVGMNVRLAGDGPSNWTTWLMVCRPKSLSRWGALQGAYIGNAFDPGENTATASRRSLVVGGKPVWLMRAIVRDYSRPNDLICDPCCGGGTTGIAALMEGRRFIGSERDPKHFEIARKRLEALKYTAISRSLFEATSGEQMALGGEK